MSAENPPLLDVGPLFQLCADAAQRGGRRPFLSLPDNSFTYAELWDLGLRAATVLADLGTAEGDVVMVLARNSTTLVGAWFGCIVRGAVFMPVNPLLTGDPLAEVLDHAQGRVLVCERALLPVLDAVRLRLDQRLVVAVGGGRVGPRAVDWDRAVSAATPWRKALADDRPDAPARLIYTSGTTGRPKGVVWSRRAEALHAIAYADELVRTDPGEAVYSCLPLSHVTCQGTLLGTLLRQGRITVDAHFDPFGFWRRIREAHAVFFPYVGTLLAVLHKRPRRPDDADNPVRRVMGSAAPADDWRDIEDRFQLRIEDVWGQTELASCWTRPASLPQRPGTVGRPTQRFQARIVDAAGRPVDDGVPGEMQVRPHHPQVIFSGYLRDPDGTAAQWTEDGWYRSGDLMMRLTTGDFVFLGRLRDAIRRRGEMISPAHIEQAALRHPDVAEAAAVGVPAEDGVEDEVKLCVVPVEGASLDCAALHRFLLERLPRFLVPRWIAVYDAFPKTPTTRIQKFRLRADGTAGAWDAEASRRRPR